MTDQAQDNPGVIIPPPVLLLTTIALVVILDWLVPLGILTKLPMLPRIVVGSVLFVLGSSKLHQSNGRTMKRAVSPYQVSLGARVMSVAGSNP